MFTAPNRTVKKGDEDVVVILPWCSDAKENLRSCNNPIHSFRKSRARSPASADQSADARNDALSEVSRQPSF
jgi:hypothetical protein